MVHGDASSRRLSAQVCAGPRSLRGAITSFSPRRPDDGGTQTRDPVMTIDQQAPAATQAREAPHPAGRECDECMLDCVVIGGGPAGLTAATYLQRFHRDLLVLDSGASRARWIPTTHNCPGFPFGVAGPDLLDKLRAQAQAYDARIERERVDRLDRTAGGFEIPD